jgi:hypothetical protein
MAPPTRLERCHAPPTDVGIGDLVVARRCTLLHAVARCCTLFHTPPLLHMSGCPLLHTGRAWPGLGVGPKCPHQLQLSPSPALWRRRAPRWALG